MPTDCCFSGGGPAGGRDRQMMRASVMKADDVIESGDAAVSICRCDGGFVLTVGEVSVCLDRGAAEDVVATLACALANDPSDASPIGDALLRELVKGRPLQ